MFLRNDIVEFINKIINVEGVNKEEIENNIKEFSKYLNLTKMADEKTLKIVNTIVDCLPQIVVLKEKLGTFDINMFLSDEKKLKNNSSKPTTEKTDVKVTDEKHYHHYHETTPIHTSSNCFSTPSYRSSNCGSAPTYSYSSSCGGGSISRSGC